MTAATITKGSARDSKRSEETREKQREKAVEQGRARAAEVEAKVRNAMKTIKAEMDANTGIYPHKGGRVSEAEVYRRAGVHPTTVPKNIDVYGDLDKDVKAWKADLLKAKKPIGREQVRLTLAERAENWKALHEDLLQVLRLTELELQEAQAKLANALKKIEDLELENNRLISEAARQAASKVKHFPTK